MNCHINKNKKAVLIILLISLLLIIIFITLVYKLLFNKQNNDIEWTEIQMDSSELNNLQLSVDNGHRPGMLAPKEVAKGKTGIWAVKAYSISKN